LQIYPFVIYDISLKEFRNNQTTHGDLLHLMLLQMVRYTASQFMCLRCS